MVRHHDRVPISIHTPVKGVTRTAGRGAGVAYFNPHTREGCDRPGGCRATLWCDISIHTPVKGVTTHTGRHIQAQTISIHTPVKGVTWIPVDMIVTYLISIHTPVKGVTRIGSEGS